MRTSFAQGGCHESTLRDSKGVPRLGVPETRYRVACK